MCFSCVKRFFVVIFVVFLNIKHCVEFNYLVINEPNMTNYIEKIYSNLRFCVLCVTGFLLLFFLFLT